MISMLGGTQLSDDEIWSTARELVAAHGDRALLSAAERLDDASASGNALEHAEWANVTLCVIRLLRPKVLHK